MLEIINFAIAAAEAPVAEPQGNASATTIVIAALSAGGLGAIFAAIVSGLFSKRKLGAEATEIITKAAAGVVSDLRSEVDRIKAARAADNLEHEQAIKDIAEAHVKERAEFMRVLQLHAAWDAIAISKVVGLPPAPPLTPANRFVGDDGMPL